MSTSDQISRLQAARNKIRTKLIALGLASSTDKLDTLATAVEGIAGNGAVTHTLDATSGNQSYTVPAGYHNGSGAVSIVLEEKTVTANGTVIPTAGKVLSSVVVNVQGAPALQNKTVSPTDSAQSVTADTGYDGLGTVTVNAVSLQNKTVTPTESVQSITRDSGYNGLGTVTVNAIPSNYADVSNVTATAANVLATKIFVTSDGTETAGTMTNQGAVSATIDGINTISYTILAGYHNGSGTVSLDSTIETALAAI